MFVSDAVVLGDVAACLKVADGPTLVAQAPYWSAVVGLAHLQSYNEIYSRLLARGYTPAQITGWDRGVEWERTFALYFALVEGGGLTREQGWILEKYERYDKNLDTVFVSVGNAWVVPGDTPGQVGHGTADTSRDLFVQDTDDVRRGQVSDF